MGGSKTKTQQNQTFANTSTYGWQEPPSTADTQALRDFKFERDPRLPYTFSRAFQRAKDTYANPLGGNTTAQLRDSTLRATAEDIGQQEAQAYREENFGMQGMEYAKRADIAQMTQPRMTQTGSSGSSSGTSTQTQSQNPLNSIIQGGSNIGAAMIM